MLTNETIAESNAFSRASYAAIADGAAMSETSEARIATNGHKSPPTCHETLLNRANNLINDDNEDAPLRTSNESETFNCPFSCQFGHVAPTNDFSIQLQQQQQFTCAMLSQTTTNSTVDNPNRKNNINSCNANEGKNDPTMSFSNLNAPRDRLWSLIDSNSDEAFSGQQFVDMSQDPSFNDPSLLSKPMMKSRAITGNSANCNLPSHSIALPEISAPLRGAVSQANAISSSNHFYGANNKNHLGTNWPTISQQSSNSIPSHGNWSNSFNSNIGSTLGSAASSNVSQGNSSMQSMWSNNIYSGVGGAPSQQRRPTSNVPTGETIKQKSLAYTTPATEGQSILSMGINISPFKYRRNPATSNFKNGNSNSNIIVPSNTYELGSTGSDNTSSSSDSANLRENCLLQFQGRNHDSHSSPLDNLSSLRYALEPQLLEMMRNGSSQDGKLFNNFNLPYQNIPQGDSTLRNHAALSNGDFIDDKKHLKGRNFGKRRGKSPFFTGHDSDNMLNDFTAGNNEHTERFSRKVFVGGLPPDIDEEEITASFRRFGPLVVDWPHKAESKSYFPPKGYAFLLFQDETSVQMLIDACLQEEDKLYLCVSSPTIKDKPVQIRPWRLSDADYVVDGSMSLDPRKTVFVGGVPRPLKAFELATIMNRLYGGVCYSGIDTDPELKYPKGAGRVAFSNQQSYIAAISARFVQLQHADIEKRVEVKPYVLDDQICDECQGARCAGKFAPYFCANITCLQYYCENCWASIHSRPGREFHKPLVKEGADRPRAVPFRWC